MFFFTIVMIVVLATVLMDLLHLADRQVVYIGYITSFVLFLLSLFFV